MRRRAGYGKQSMSGGEEQALDQLFAKGGITPDRLAHENPRFSTCSGAVFCETLTVRWREADSNSQSHLK